MKLFIMLAAVLIALCIQAAPIRDSTDTRLTLLENGIQEVRRDQLNYRIERDLLKETFSSHFQTVNFLFTIILGIFTVLGFLGIKDISAIKKEYEGELVSLKSLRLELESKINAISNEQGKAKQEYLEIVKTNEEQNKRLRMLELKEKVAACHKDNQFQRGLEYVALALELDPNNIHFLSQKAIALWRLNDYFNAIQVYRRILELDPKDATAVTNLIELLVLSGSIKDFDLLYEKNRGFVEARSDSRILNIHFKLLKLYHQNDVEQMKIVMDEFLKSVDDEKKTLSDWGFDDALRYLQRQADDHRKKIIRGFVAIVTGKNSKEEIVDYLKT